MQTYMHKHIPLYYIHIKASNLKKVVEKPRKHWKLNQIKNELKKFKQQTVQTIKSWFISSNKFSRKTPATNANAKRLHTSILGIFLFTGLYMSTRNSACADWIVKTVFTVKNNNISSSNNELVVRNQSCCKVTFARCRVSARRSFGR